MADGLCFRNPYFIVHGTQGPSDAVLKAQELLDADRVLRLLSVCMHKNLIPALSTRQSLRDGSVYVGSPGIAYAFVRLAAMEPELLASAELSSTTCCVRAEQLLSETLSRDPRDAPQSLMLGVSGHYLVCALSRKGCSTQESYIQEC